MPAAAVIPAPIAYTKDVAVKKLVVGFLDSKLGPFLTECVLGIPTLTQLQVRSYTNLSLEEQKRY